MFIKLLTSIEKCPLCWFLFLYTWARDCCYLSTVFTMLQNKVLAVACAFIQELVLNAVLELQGSIVDSEKMSGLLGETQASIDHHRSMLHELLCLQVCITLQCHFLCDGLGSRMSVYPSIGLCPQRAVESSTHSIHSHISSGVVVHCCDSFSNSVTRPFSDVVNPSSWWSSSRPAVVNHPQHWLNSLADCPPFGRYDQTAVVSWLWPCMPQNINILCLVLLWIQSVSSARYVCSHCVMCRNLLCTQSSVATSKVISAWMDFVVSHWPSNDNWLCTQ